MYNRLLGISKVLRYTHEHHQSLDGEPADSTLGIVSVSRIRDAIIDLGHVDRIVSEPRTSELNSGLQGAFQKKKCGNDRKEARIFYDKNLPYKTYRFVLAKELAHVFDKDFESTSTEAQIMDILDFVVNTDASSDDPGHQAEEKAKQCAVEFLFPFECRNKILSESDGMISSAKIETISDKFMIPRDKVAFGLQQGYHEYIRQIRDHLEIKDLF